MGYLPGAASKYGNRWVRVPITDPDYGALAEDLTVNSVAANLDLAPPLSLTHTMTINGAQAVGVQGTTKPRGKKATLFVPTSRSRLPVGLLVHDRGIQASESFGRWNGSFDLTRPTGAVPISSTGLE